jgi:hypothetical protein
MVHRNSMVDLERTHADETLAEVALPQEALPEGLKYIR